MDTEEYHKHPAVSASILKRILIDDETYEVACGIPVEETEAMKLGTLIHLLILEPHRFSDEYAVMPKVDGRTKEGKAAKAAFELQANGKIVVDQEQYDTALKCVEAFNNNETARLMTSGTPELKLFSEMVVEYDEELVIYDEDGKPTNVKFDDNGNTIGILVPTRGMLDWYDEESGLIVDLKTTQTFGDKFVKECGDRGYVIQAAFYYDLLRSLGKPVNGFVFIGLQTKGRHKITITQVGTPEIENGRDFYQVGIDIWLDIKANPEKYKKQLCRNPADGSIVFEYVTPMWQHFKIDKLRKQKGVSL